MPARPAPNVGIAQALCEALSGENVDGADSSLDEASLFHVPGRSGLAGDYQGREAILGLAKRMAELTDGTLRLSEPSAAVEGGVLRLHGRVRATRHHKYLDTDVELVVSTRRGRVQEVWISHEDQPHVDDFWS